MRHDDDHAGLAGCRDKRLNKDWEVRFYLSAAVLPQGQGGGVYLLFVDELLDYVGQSDDVRRRLMGSIMCMTRNCIR